MRVTLVTPEWPGLNHSGGVARYAYRLAEQLRENVTLTVVTVEGNDALLDGVTILRAKRDEGRFGRYYVLPFRLRRLVASSRPDLVHSFGDDWALGHRWPTVRTFHGSALAEARSSKGLRRMNHYVLSAFEHATARWADVRVAVGADSMTEFNCQTSMPPVVPIARNGDRGEKPSVVFVGSFHGRKRGWMVAEAVSDYRRLHGVDVGLTVIGPSSDRDSWPDYCNHRSDLNDTDVQDEISRAWVLAAPSSYEGFGIPAFEALALGTPVVTSPTPGSEFMSELMYGNVGLDIVSDDDFAGSLLRRLRNGRPDAAEIPTSQIEPLLALSRHDRLVDEIYPQALHAFRWNSSRRRL